MKRVLFVCLGNSCRSQMAEAFARRLCFDVMEAASAGLMPASIIAPPVHEVMAEKGIELGEHFPKPLEWMKPADFDLIVNMSGFPLTEVGATPVVEWTVEDPIGGNLKKFRRVRDQIEEHVLKLAARFRNGA